MGRSVESAIDVPPFTDELSAAFTTLHQGGRHEYHR
jgi:hypothetical protein